MKLYFYPRLNQVDFSQILEAYQYEFDARYGALVFEEEEDTIDALEMELQEAFDEYGVSGYFEAE